MAVKSVKDKSAKCMKIVSIYQEVSVKYYYIKRWKID